VAPVGELSAARRPAWPLCQRSSGLATLIDRFDRRNGMRQAVRNVGKSVCRCPEISHHRDEVARRRKAATSCRKAALPLGSPPSQGVAVVPPWLIVGDARGLRLGKRPGPLEQRNSRIWFHQCNNRLVRAVLRVAIGWQGPITESYSINEKSRTRVELPTADDLCFASGALQGMPTAENDYQTWLP